MIHYGDAHHTTLQDYRHYTWSPALSGRVIAIQWAPAVVGVGGLTASVRRPRRSFHNWAAGHFHHSKSAQPMTRATGDNKDSGNAQRNEDRRPDVSNVQLGTRAFNFSRVMSSICGNACQSGCSRRVCKSSCGTRVDIFNGRWVRIAGVIANWACRWATPGSVQSRPCTRQSAATLNINMPISIFCRISGFPRQCMEYPSP